LNWEVAITGFVIGIIAVGIAAAFLVYANLAGRDAPPTAPMDRRARRADQSVVRRPSSPRHERRPRPKESIRLFERGEPAPVEALGVTRRQFFNRGIFAAQVLALASLGSAVMGFLWPSLSGGFGSKVNAGPMQHITSSLLEKREPFYVPEARSYLNPYPAEALPAAKKAYSDNIVAGMALGLVALFQKCPHLGCRVPWCKTSQWFECPCHGSKYNRVGEKKGGPAPRGMDRFPLDVVNGNVVVNTGIVVLGPPIGTNTTGQEAEGPNCV
jgi:cytochrome b6-f complex iron-sulfur subunit